MSQEEVEQSLIPGLADAVVLDCVLPRLPWHSRPVLRAASRTWKHALQNATPYTHLTHLASRLQGLVMVHQTQPQKTCHNPSSVAPHAISIYDPASSTWRQLPPIPAFHPLPVLHDCALACLRGTLFVMGGWDPRTDALSALVFALDLGGGHWEWRAAAPMLTPKAFFHSVADPTVGRIYVVGGAQHQQEPLPEFYDLESDTWRFLPSVSPSRSIHFNGLALLQPSLLLAHGYCAVDRGDLAPFWRLYDPATDTWTEYDSAHMRGCSKVVNGDYDLRDGVICAFDRWSKSWRPFSGKRVTGGATWRWEAGQKVPCESTCAHGLIVSAAHGVAFATLCGGESQSLSTWQAVLDHVGMRVSWSRLPLPGNLAMCSEMCYLS